MIHPAFDRAKGVVNETCTGLNLRWIRYHPLPPVFHDAFVHPARDSTVLCMARARRF
jgi:hypothetical protein